MGYVLKLWKAVRQNNNSWIVQDDKGRVIASVNSIKNADRYAKLFAASPYMLEALKAVANLMGDDDLPDNGEFSGAAVSDFVRSAIDLCSRY